MTFYLSPFPPPCFMGKFALSPPQGVLGGTESFLWFTYGAKHIIPKKSIRMHVIFIKLMHRSLNIPCFHNICHISI